MDTDDKNPVVLTSGSVPPPVTDLLANAQPETPPEPGSPTAVPSALGYQSPTVPQQSSPSASVLEPHASATVPPLEHISTAPVALPESLKPSPIDPPRLPSAHINRMPTPSMIEPVLPPVSEARVEPSPPPRMETAPPVQTPLIPAAEPSQPGVPPPTDPHASLITPPVLPSHDGSGSTPVAPPKKHLPKMVAVVGAIILLLIAGWALTIRTYMNRVADTEVTTPTVTRIQEAGKLVIGTDSTFAPMEFINEAGEFAGYDVELGQRIAEKLGVTAEFKTIIFDEFINELNNGTVDVVISSVSITDERKQLVSFSDPYLNAGQVIVTRKEDESIASVTDLQGKRIAVQKGTTNEEKAREFTSEESILKFDNFEEATDALLTASADAIFSDLTGVKGILDANPVLKVTGDPFTTEEYGIVFRKGDEDLVIEVNSILNGLRQQGILTFLKQKWLE